MKKALALTCAMTMAASLFLTGCGGSDYTTMSGNGSDNNSGSSNGSGKRVVNVCSWGEYIDEDLIYKFEDETGIVQLPAYAKYDGRLLVILGSSGKRISFCRLRKQALPMPKTAR